MIQFFCCDHAVPQVWCAYRFHHRNASLKFNYHGEWTGCGQNINISIFQVRNWHVQRLSTQSLALLGNGALQCAHLSTPVCMEETGGTFCNRSQTCQTDHSREVSPEKLHWIISWAGMCEWAQVGLVFLVSAGDVTDIFPVPSHTGSQRLNQCLDTCSLQSIPLSGRWHLISWLINIPPITNVMETADVIFPRKPLMADFTYKND